MGFTRGVPDAEVDEIFPSTPAHPRYTEVDEPQDMLSDVCLALE